MIQDDGNVVSLTHRPPLPPGNTPGTHFWVDPRAIVRWQWKIAMASSGVEPATFRFVAQHINHCATAVPSPLSLSLSLYIYIYISVTWRWPTVAETCGRQLHKVGYKTVVFWRTPPPSLIAYNTTGIKPLKIKYPLSWKSINESQLASKQTNKYKRDCNTINVGTFVLPTHWKLCVICRFFLL